MERIVLIGGSAGSLEILLQIFSGLPADLPHPIVLILHRKASEDQLLENLFAAKSALKVVAVEDKTPLCAGCLFIAPSDYHLLFERDWTLSVDTSPKVNYSRPSIDVSFESAADAYGFKVLAVLLSGANSDGTAGLAAIQAAGGLAVVQDPTTAQVPAMPQSAIDSIRTDSIANPQLLAKIIKTGSING